MAYAHVEPFGEDRDDWRAAMMTAMVAEVNRNPKSRNKPFKPEEFLLKFKDPEEEQSWETQLEFVKMFNAAFGGTVGKK